MSTVSQYMLHRLLMYNYSIYPMTETF